MTGEAPTLRHVRLAPALVTDLPVLLAFVGRWVLVPVGWAHVLIGMAMAGLVVVHLRSRPGLARRLLRRPRSVRRFTRQASSWLVVAAAAAVTVTGLLRWAGLPPEHTWHGGTGWALLAAVTVHLWLVRRPLWARLHHERRTR